MKIKFGRLRKRTKSNMCGFARPYSGCMTDFTNMEFITLKSDAMTMKTMPRMMFCEEFAVAGGDVISWNPCAGVYELSYSEKLASLTA